MDRMITIKLDHPDPETEVEIVTKKSGVERNNAIKIVNIMRELRKLKKYKFKTTIRSGIAIAKILAKNEGQPFQNNACFRQTFYDVFSQENANTSSIDTIKFKQVINGVIEKSYPVFHK